jgi:spore coat assembly protein SafA
MSSYTVRSGDTMSAIAARYGISLSKLEQANPQVSNPNLIYVGQSLNIPDSFTPAPAAPPPANTSGQTVYTVRSGDTLSGIAARFGTTYQAIAAANGISNPNVIYPGQQLRIPGGNASAPAPAQNGGGTVSRYTVEPGDTLSGIGARFGVSWQAIASANHISDPNLIYPGQQLIIPGGSGAPPPPSNPSPGTGTENWTPGPGQLQGADTSSWQSDATFQQSLQGAQWGAIKATEGTGWTDPTFQARWNEMGQMIQNGQMKLRVAYEFLHAGDGTAQAQHFLAALGVNGPLPAGTRLALDWEADALNDPQALTDAANYIHQVTGLWPLIYCSASQVGRAQAAVPNAPIWEADWSSNVPTNQPFVQYSDGPGYDHDVFNGDLAALERFAGW